MGLDFSTLLNAALGGTAAYQSGRRTRADNEEKKAATAAALARQTEIDAENKQIHDAQIADYQAQAAERTRQANLPAKTTSEQDFTSYVDDLVSKGYTLDHAAEQARKRFGKAQEAPVFGTAPYMAAKKQEAIDAAQASNQYGYHAPQAGAQDHFVAAGVDANGQPVILNTRTGQTQQGGGFRGGSGSGGGTGGLGTLGQQTGLEAGIHTLRAADASMTKFEDKVLAHHQTVNPLMKAAANIAGDPTHNPLLAPFAEGALNTFSPEYATYARDAKAAAIAVIGTQPRGSDARLKAETVLASLSSAPTPETVAQVREWRKNYITAIQGATDRIDTSRGQPAGSSSSGGSSVSRPALTSAQKARAASDPAYKAFLAAKGY